MGSVEEEMICYPEWLPEIINCDGDPYEVIARLYAVFVRDFKQTKPLYRGYLVNHKKRPESYLGRTYEEGFLHIITKGQPNNRLQDNRRAERISWCRPLIENSDEELIWAWDFKESFGPIRTYIWLKDYDYCVVLQKINKNEYLLITGYHVSGNFGRNLKKKFKNRIFKNEIAASRDGEVTSSIHDR